MAHTIRKVNVGNTAFCDVVITDYVQGGESFTLAELGLTGAVTRIFLFRPYLTGLWAPVVVGNAIKLMDPSLSYESPATVGINFPVVALVTGN